MADRLAHIAPPVPVAPSAPVAPVALVTGAGRGLGAAVARALHTEGWKVALIDVAAVEPIARYAMASDHELAAVAAEVEAEVAVAADVRDGSKIVDAVEETVRRHGRLDAAISCAGVIDGGEPVWEIDAARWQWLFDVNVTGTWNLVRAAIPAMLASPGPRRGRFVAIASAAGLIGMPRLAAYNASKHAVVGLIRGLAADLAGLDITANAVCPGSMRTAMLEASARLYDLADVEEFARHHLTRRLLDPAEVASMVAWLCSDQAGGITGSVFAADGGMTAV